VIARLRGLVAEKGPSRAVIMAGGVGYEVFIPLATFYELPDEGGEVDLHVRTVVRDDAIELFGFKTHAEKEMFLLLNTISKIGPRLALAILSGINPGALAEAVVTRNVGRLNAIPGVGAKTAERIMVELKDKVAHLAALTGPVADGQPAGGLDEVGRDVVSALLNLGYNRNEAERAVVKSREDMGDQTPELAALLRSSLKKLQKA
jgi:Holliday junction DNA helicase RuvA